MTQKEIVLWLDQRWYDALSRHLKDLTLEEHLEEVIDRLCNDLPEREYKRISEAIWQEKQDARHAAEAARRFAVFHVTEGDDSLYFIAEEDIDMLHSAILNLACSSESLYMIAQVGGNVKCFFEGVCVRCATFYGAHLTQTVQREIKTEKEKEEVCKSPAAHGFHGSFTPISYQAYLNEI